LLWPFCGLVVILGGLAFVQNMNEAAVKLIGALLVVTPFVERSLAAINAAVFGKKRELIETKLLNARLAPAAIPSDKALTASADKAREDLADVAGDEERSRVIFGYLFALLISSAGVRTLQSLVVFPSSETVQASVGHVMDIAIDSGVTRRRQ
jgi:hypothetical protein